MKFLIFFLILLPLGLVKKPSADKPKADKPSVKKPLVHLILDTDIGPDYDDVGAISMFHAFADNGEMIPLAIVASNKNRYVAPVINLLNTFYGRPNLPIGRPPINAPNMGASQHWPEMILKKYPHSIKSTSEIPEAVNVYRKILAEQPNHSVTIATIGFLSNLANLLKSKPDHYSELNGRELVKIKVKELISMAGNFPEGHEFNLYTDSVSSAAVFSNWPGKIIFSGFEIGKQIKTGLGLISDKKLKSPIKDVFAFCMPKSAEDAQGRMSWDESAVFVAVRGAKSYFGLTRGHILIHGGQNSWFNDLHGRQYYLTQVSKPEKMAKMFEYLMRQKPARN